MVNTEDLGKTIHIYKKRLTNHFQARVKSIDSTHIKRIIIEGTECDKLLRSVVRFPETVNCV